MHEYQLVNVSSQSTKKSSTIYSYKLKNEFVPVRWSKSRQIQQWAALLLEIKQNNERLKHNTKLTWRNNIAASKIAEIVY